MTKVPASEIERRREFFAEALKSFPVFCAMLKVVPFETLDGGDASPIPMELTALQKRFCRNRSGWDIILKPRKAFITSLEVAFDIWWFLTHVGASVVIVCQTEQDGKIKRDIAAMLRIYADSLLALGIPLPFKRDTFTWDWPERQAKLRVVEAGAAEKTAHKGGKGGAVTRLHCTEIAYWDQAQTTAISYMNSMPKRGTSVTLESTPHGKSGYFYEVYQTAKAGESKFKPHFYAWYEHTHNALPLEPGERIVPGGRLEEIETLLMRHKGVSPEQIKWLRAKFSESQDISKLREDYPNDENSCWLMGGRGFFDQAIIDANFLTCALPLRLGPDDDDKGRLTVWENAKRSSSYVIGADPAGGGGDPLSAIVWERGSGKHVATLHSNQFDEQEFSESLIALSRRYNDAKLAVERENHGHSVILAIKTLKEAKRLYVHSDGKHGWPENAATRPVMLDGFAAAYRRGTVKTHDASLLGEMQSFVISTHGKPEADRGHHDDLVMAAAIGWHVVTTRQAPSAQQARASGVAPAERTYGFDRRHEDLPERTFGYDR